MELTHIKINNINKLLAGCFGVSMLLHFLLLAFAYKYPVNPNPYRFDEEDPVAVKIVSPRDSADILDSMRGQIVDLVDDFPSRKPKEYTPYLSEKNRSVESETQASATDIDPNAPFTSLGGGERKDILSFTLSERERGRSESENKTGLTRKMPGETQENEPASSRDRLSLQPTQEELSRFFAVAPNNYLPNVAIGNSTLLNTRSYAYAGFFIRMKRLMESIWDPQPILARTVIEKKELYVTSLNIVLNPDGSLVSVQIDKSSGVRELDREALRTVKESAPFPNPPKDLLSPDKKIHIPQWNFIIQFQRRIF